MIASAVARVGDRFRRSSGLVVLVLTLGMFGGAYAAFAPASQADETPSSIAVREGQKLYNNGCITCHGRNAQGVPGRGPSLIGVGSAAVEFQVSSGRMPAARQEAQAKRKPPVYNKEQTDQLAAFVQSLGGGPQVPQGDLRDGDLAQGGRLFRVNCASCHGLSGNGGALSSGKFAPALSEATDQQVYAAMLSGPQNMPVFGDNQLTPDEKKAIVNYVQTLKAEKDPGGMGIGRTGPVPEGLVIFVVGIVVLLFATIWIAGKS
jgi:ubiquinol-cytochrome c reductase cytochrome c subunit